MARKGIVLGMVLALGLFFIGFASQGLAEEKGLVSWWKFDEGKGTIAKDSSGKGNDGTLVGWWKFDEGTREEAIWTDGRKTKVLSFGRRNCEGVEFEYVDCGKDTSLDITGEITIEVWLKRDRMGNDNTIFQRWKMYEGGKR